MAGRRGRQGRPTSLTPQTQTVITEALTKGMTLKRALEVAGIAESTYWAWQRRAREGEEPFCSFAEAVTHARAKCQEELLDLIQIAAIEPKNWRAAAWILERRYPDEWGETVKHTVREEVAKELGAFLAACRDQLPHEVWERVRGVAERMGDGASGGDVAANARH